MGHAQRASDEKRDQTMKMYFSEISTLKYNKYDILVPGSVAVSIPPDTAVPNW